MVRYSCCQPARGRSAAGSRSEIVAAAAGATGRGSVTLCDAAVWDCGVGRSQLHF